MRSRLILHSCFLAAVCLHESLAADCNLSQARKDGNPSGQQFVRTLTSNNNTEIYLDSAYPVNGLFPADDGGPVDHITSATSTPTIIGTSAADTGLTTSCPQKLHDFSHLTIEGPDRGSSITTSTSTFNACSTCTPANVTPVQEPGDVADIDPDFPFIISDDETPSGTPSSPSSPSTHSAVPIDQPACNKNDAEAPPRKIQVSDGSTDIRDLLYRIRQQICAGPCAALEDVRQEVVNITSSSDGANCAISVRVSQRTEAYMYRTSAPEGDQRQQCWDSAEHIINKYEGDVVGKL
ncbi:hypothetical protein K469DRAFT_693530 [Zopfia rhizophila CBS 207.26]|uniref:Uncharacterized protein n=1 Tax=Zopfia rhizophila CBS 207.26 TaxID=1314779 RepID=A0A6A6DM35_9PEZI|nr:hypothetical protein K469DRAFT_693530 [Zopfia rhizophila CBS 207.26]